MVYSGCLIMNTERMHTNLLIFQEFLKEYCRQKTQKHWQKRRRPPTVQQRANVDSDGYDRVMIRRMALFQLEFKDLKGFWMTHIPKHAAIFYIWSNLRYIALITFDDEKYLQTQFFSIISHTDNNAKRVLVEKQFIHKHRINVVRFFAGYQREIFLLLTISSNWSVHLVWTTTLCSMNGDIVI